MTGTGVTTFDARLERRRRAILAALVVASATTVITGCAHSIGGGMAPDALLLTTAFVATLLVLAPVLGSRVSPVRQALAVLVAQLGQHWLYSLPEAASAAATHVHDPAVAMQGASLVHVHTAMPLAHAAAGLVTLALLRLAPRVVGAVLAAASLRTTRAMLDWSAPPAGRAASVTAARPALGGSLELLRTAVLRRGPPAAHV